ncbi:unnamed protein product [Prunus armeniaca]
MSSHPPNDSESAFGLQHPSTISLRPSAFGTLRSFGVCDVFTSPQCFGIGLRHPSIIQRVRCLHIPPMIQNRPSAPFHHSMRAMSSHPPNDSESAFSTLQPSVFGHQPSAPFNHSAHTMSSHPPNDSASAFGTS